MKKALQVTLNLLNHDGSRPGRRRPMLGIESLKREMDMGEDDVLGEIAGKRLRWAFDLKTADSDKVFLRVWEHGVAYWRAKDAVKLAEDWTDLFRAILPANSFMTGQVLATELQAAFNVTSGHVMNLIEQKALVVSDPPGGGKKWRRGPGGSPRITRASIEKFLKQRRLD